MFIRTKIFLVDRTIADFGHI